jgi:hypothetical protein
MGREPTPFAVMMFVTDLAGIVVQACTALEKHRSLARVEGVVPDRPGLYAIHGDGYTWTELGLGKPPDDRPLYVGKAEDSLVTRDVRTHFGDGRTGQSTVCRSLAALLHDEFGLQGIPRNTAKPGYYSKLRPLGRTRCDPHSGNSSWSLPLSKRRPESAGF